MASAKFWEIISRGESGEPTTEKDFDMLLFKTTKKLCRKYGLKFDPENLVPTDDTMIENAFRAGMELLLTTGVFNIDSGRVIRVTEEEIFDALQRNPSQILLGSGKDQVTLRHRGIEDPVLPAVIGGTGNPVSEDIRYRLYLAYARNPMIDYIEPLPPTSTGICW